MDRSFEHFNHVYHLVSLAKLNDKIRLPRVAVIGSQSHGKSSVLQAFARFDFLPSGEGLVTKCPIVMQFYKTNTEEPYVIFEHEPKKIYNDFDDVRNEIIEESIRLAGPDKVVTEHEITISIYSKDVVNLTLIDLPGLVQIQEHNQPKDLRKMVQNIVKKYI